MIAVFVNSMADTATFAPLFKDIEGISLYNPTREELEKVLTENPTETLMCLGHGSPRGLFSADMNGFLLDRNNVHLLKDREMIGIWCYASDFARIHNLRGFFTYMFISNEQECSVHRCGSYDNEVVYEQNRLFAEKVRGLIVANVPMEEWVDFLYESCDNNLAFVDFNYSNLSYFDGESNYVPQSLLDEEREREQIAQAESYLFDDWEEGTLWHGYCISPTEYIVCYTDNDHRQKWEEYNSYEDMVNRVNDLSAELYEEYASKIMVFEKDSQI
jgi:hypothetical protein